MNRWIRSVLRFARTLAEQRDGSALVEYVLLIALVVFGSIAGMSNLAMSLGSAYNQVALNFSDAMATHDTGSAGSGGGSGSGSGSGRGNHGGPGGGIGQGSGSRGNNGGGNNGGGGDHHHP